MFDFERAVMRLTVSQMDFHAFQFQSGGVQSGFTPLHFVPEAIDLDSFGLALLSLQTEHRLYF
jgi:hypothetical protein